MQHKTNSIGSQILIVILLLSATCLTRQMVFGATNVEYRSDQIVIQPKAGVSKMALTLFHAAHGAKVAHVFPKAGGVQIITVPALIAQYQQGGLVAFAEPDYLVYADATQPNDPKFQDGTLWGLHNYGQSGGTAYADIDATDGWDVMISASNIVVAVLDSGIRATHEELAANMWVNPIAGIMVIMSSPAQTIRAMIPPATGRWLPEC